jgi:hypothetical protein
MILKRKDANSSKRWKVSQKLFFALRIILENDGRVIGINLAADSVAHFLVTGFIEQFLAHLAGCCRPWFRLRRARCQPTACRR